MTTNISVGNRHCLIIMTINQAIAHANEYSRTSKDCHIRAKEVA